MPVPFAFVLVVITMLRLYSVIRSIIWIRQRHTEFKDLVDRLDEDDRRKADSYAAIYDQTGGSFFPLGVKSYRLRRFARSGTPAARLLKFPLRAVRTLWTLYVYIPVSSGALLVMATWPGQISPATTWMIYTVGLLLCACSIAIAAEGVVAQKTLGDWAKYHYHFKDEGLAKWKLWAGSAILTWGAATSYLAFTSSRLGGFPQIPDSGSWFGHVLDAAFYSLGSLGLFGSPETSLPAARATLGVLWLTGVAFLLILLTELSGGGPAIGEKAASPAPRQKTEKPPKAGRRGSRRGVVVVVLLGCLWIVWKAARHVF